MGNKSTLFLIVGVFIFIIMPWAIRLTFVQGEFLSTSHCRICQVRLKGVYQRLKKLRFAFWEWTPSRMKKYSLCQNCSNSAKKDLNFPKLAVGLEEKKRILSQQKKKDYYLKMWFFPPLIVGFAQLLSLIAINISFKLSFFSSRELWKELREAINIFFSILYFPTGFTCQFYYYKWLRAL